jgi:hypothetical protein
MVRKRMRKTTPDWRRDNMWVGKGVPFWLALLAIAGTAWIAAQAFRH